VAYPTSLSSDKESALRALLSRCIPIRPVQESVSMLPTVVRLPLVIALALFFTSANPARAQEGVPPMPDPTYGAGAYSYQSPTDLPMPAPDDLTNPNVVTIPIPGGGDVTVDGPNAPDEKPIPTLPGSNWGVFTQNPYSHDVGPVGPSLQGGP
jgi:hypothetical protein